MTRRAIITKEQVKLIRAEYLPYVRGYNYLSKKYSVGISTIRDICTYRTHINVRT